MNARRRVESILQRCECILPSLDVVNARSLIVHGEWGKLSYWSARNFMNTISQFPERYLMRSNRWQLK